jgi:hypothetical protein
VNVPLRVVMAIGVAALLAALAALALLRVPYVRGLGLSRRQRWLVAMAAVLFLVGMCLWVVLVLPAYWD